MTVDCAIIGGGIVGLSVAVHLTQQQPGMRLVVLEKETELATHQSGHNSGVIHSGIYYSPGSLKARFAGAGNRPMIDFCARHGIAHEVCGKIIVATVSQELALLERLYRRGLQNQVEVKQLSSAEVREREPHVRCLGGLSVPKTAIVNFRSVCTKYAELIEKHEGTIQTGAEVREIRGSGSSYLLETTKGAVEARFLINCGGLHSDRIARCAGSHAQFRIIPFRGEYYELLPQKRYLVKGLIYPMPSPSFPFLGVHFTRMIDGSVHAGPNAVLALKREGYRKIDIGFRDFFETATYGGFWKLARKHYREGLAEIHRSLSKSAFVKQLQTIVPAVTEKDLVPAKSGVRAQALAPDGTLVDDFFLAPGPNAIHVCNAPSPAATASLEIGKEIARQVPQLRTTTTIGFGNSSVNHA